MRFLGRITFLSCALRTLYNHWQILLASEPSNILKWLFTVVYFKNNSISQEWQFYIVE